MLIGHVTGVYDICEDTIDPGGLISLPDMAKKPIPRKKERGAGGPPSNGQ